MTARWRRGLLGAFAAAIFALAGAGFAQEAPSAADGEIAVDYQAWTEMAEKVEAAIEDRSVQDSDLDTLRGQLVSWREALLGAQNANSARISTMRAQIEALGPPPAEGQLEPDDLAKRRVDLAQQLLRIQAPAIAADEAYRRADGLIREIDRTLRERQADQLLQVWPAPINPANWPEALIGLTDTGIRLWDEVVENWADDARRAAFFTNLPLIVLGLTVGFLLA
ncbi:MAG: DUF3772 domain-containing protein, partial [Cypionkella sp.]